MHGKAKARRGALLVCLVLCLCLLVAGETGRAMEVESGAFDDQGSIPVRYCMPGVGGKNISIPLRWSDVPEGVRSFALSMIDPHPVADNWVHWLVTDLPADTRALPEGASGSDMPRGARELRNSYGKTGYGGPRPPEGTGEHPYVVTVYALDTVSLYLERATELEAFKRAIQGHVLDKAKVTGFFGQK